MGGNRIIKIYKAMINTGRIKKSEIQYIHNCYS